MSENKQPFRISYLDGEFIVGPGDFKQRVEVGGFIFTAKDAVDLQNVAYIRGRQSLMERI